MKVQFNYELSAEEAKPFLAEARRRGMVDGEGRENRAMIARTLAAERLGQITAETDSKLTALLTEARAAKVNVSAVLRKAIRGAKS